MTLKNGAIVALVLVAIAQGVALYLGRRALWEAQVATANAKAEHDRTRVRMAGDILVAERLALQVAVQLDAALKRTGQTDHALVRVRVERDSLRALVPLLVAIDTGAAPAITLRAKLDARDSLGLYIATTTELRGFFPVGPTPNGWTRFEVTREPLQLDVALSCQGPDAVAQVSGPRWATIDLSRVEQRPEICNPRPPVWRPFTLRVPSLPWAVGLVGLGFVLAR